MKSTSRRTTASKTKKPGTARTKPASLDKALKTYEDALKLLNRREYTKAAQAFAAVIKEFPAEREICDRARIYQSLCKAQTAGPGPKPKNSDESYCKGVMAANDGRLQEAAEIFDSALKQDPDNHKLRYAMAGVNTLMDDREGALANLGKAIELNASNKILALNDADFDPLREDPEFLTLVGKAPEASA